MEKKIKLTRKELRSPDEFQQTGFRALDFAREKAKWLWMGAGILVLLAVAAGFYSRYRQGETEKASWEISKLVRDIQSYESAAQVESADSNARWVGFADRASALATRYKRTSVAPWARILQGKGLLKAGKAAEAVAPIEEGLKHVRYPLLVAIGTELLGYDHLEKGETEKARATFKKLETIDSPLKGVVPYYLALVLEKEGKTEEAKKTFEQASTESTSTLFWGRKIRDDILMRELGTSDAWLKQIQRDSVAK